MDDARKTLIALALIAPALAAAPAKAPAGPPRVAETVVNAAAIDDDLPGPLKSYSVSYPYTTTMRFAIDKVGKAEVVGFEPEDVSPDVKRALESAVERWKFWPAVGACRYVAQTATKTVTFEEKRVTSKPTVYEPVPPAEVQPADGFGWLFPADAGDRRQRAWNAPAGLVEPVGLKQVPPRFPANASRAAQVGMAMVLFEVRADGRMGRVLHSEGWSPEPKLASQFASASTAALKQWRFKPAAIGGKPQSRYACQRFMFNMSLGR